MEAIVIVPVVLALNTAVASQIVSRFDFTGLPYKTKCELLNRISSIMFQLYLCYNGIYLTPERAEWVAGSMVGYMIYETIHMTFYCRSIDMYIHHAVFPLAYILSISYMDKEERLAHLTRITTIAWMLESTAPFLTVSWCLHTFKYPNNTFHKIFKVLTGVYWSFIRIGVFPYYIYLVNDVRYYSISIPLYALQLYWFRLIVKKIVLK